MTRYNISESHGMYCVIDVLTGDIAKVNDVWLEGLDIQDADEVAEALNLIEESRPTEVH